MRVKIFSESPNVREIRRVAGRLGEGAIAVLPTDTLYAFACSMQFKRSVEDIARLKGFKLKQAKYSLLCASLSQVSEYVRPLDKETFSLLKSALPGPFTFILEANGNVPRNYQNANRTIGVRVPDNVILRAIIEELGCPLIATSVRLINEEMEKEYLTDPELIHELFEHRVDLVVDGGMGDDNPSTVIDCSSNVPKVLRYGKGEIDL